jgi:hypothetical protein
LVGVVAARPKSREISIQWALWGAPFRCVSEGPVSNPTFPELPSEALTNRYAVAAFGRGDLLRLPVRTEWKTREESTGGTFRFRLFGSVILKRVYHQIR